MDFDDRDNRTNIARFLGAVGLIGATLGMGAVPASGQAQPKPSASATPKVRTDAVVELDSSSRQVKIEADRPSAQQKLESPTTSSRQLKLTDNKAKVESPTPPK